MSNNLTPNERFELLLKTPDMKRAQAALKAVDDFWAAQRAQGERNRLGVTAYLAQTKERQK